VILCFVVGTALETVLDGLLNSGFSSPVIARC